MKRTLLSALACSLLAVSIPAAASADPGGGCPPARGTQWFEVSDPPDGGDNVGAPVDRDGDGLCIRVNKAGKTVWKDDTNPSLS